MRTENISGHLYDSLGQKKKTTGTQSQSFAQTLNKAILGQTLLGARYINQNGAVTLEGMERELKEMCDEFKKELNRHLSSAGLSQTDSFELEFASNGRIQVRGSHPDKEQIERMFTDDPAFRDLAAKVCVLKDSIESLKESSAFQEAYSSNPVKAVAQYGHHCSAQSTSYTILCQKDFLWNIAAKKISNFSKNV